jgi:hypothetical protein
MEHSLLPSQKLGAAPFDRSVIDWGNTENSFREFRLASAFSLWHLQKCEPSKRIKWAALSRKTSWFCARSAPLENLAYHFEMISLCKNALMVHHLNRKDVPVITVQSYHYNAQITTSACYHVQIINAQSSHYKAFLSRRCLDIELICKLSHGINCLGLGSNRVLVFHDCSIIYVS